MNWKHLLKGQTIDLNQKKKIKRIYNGTPLQYPCLENPMDGGAWKAAVHGVAEGRTRLSDFTFTFHFHALEKEMATHSSVLAWRIPGMREPDGLPSTGLHRVRLDWSDLAAACFQGSILRLQLVTRVACFWGAERIKLTVSSLPSFQQPL